MEVDAKTMLTQKAMQVIVSLCLLIFAHVIAKACMNLVLHNRRDENRKGSPRAKSSYALIFRTVANLIYIGIMVVAVFISIAFPFASRKTQLNSDVALTRRFCSGQLEGAGISGCL